MSRSSRRLVSFLAAATVVSTVAACGGDDGGGSGGGGGGGEGGENEASDIGVTEDTIRLGAHFPLTGVAAPGYSEIPLGAQAYFDCLNEAGGIYGREIEYLYEDDAYNPTNTTSVVNQLVLEDEIFAMLGGLGTPTHRAVLEFLNSEGVPDLFVSSGSLLWGDQPEEYPYTFGWQTDYMSEGKIIGQYIAEEFPDATVGLFLQDDDFGEDGEAGIREFIDDDQIVEVQRYTPGNTNVGPQISALAASDADVVVGMTVPAYTALSQLRSSELGFDPQWIYSNVGSDPTLVGSLLGILSQGAVTDAAPLLDGAITTDYLPTVDEPDNEWVQVFQQIWDQCGGEGELSNYKIYGMSQAYTATQALQAAGQNPTREGLVEAIEQVGSEWEGPVLAPFRYSEDSHLGTGGMSLSRLTGETTEEIRPVQLTDIGGAEIEEYDGEPASPPENGIPDEEPYEG